MACGSEKRRQGEVRRAAKNFVQIGLLSDLEVTGHKTVSAFKRYGKLVTEALRDVVEDDLSAQDCPWTVRNKKSTHNGPKLLTKMVEAAGVEPASANSPWKLLHA